jgi:hypothetical protein
VSTPRNRDRGAGNNILGNRVAPDAPKPGQATARRTKPVRITVDLDPPLYSDVAAWSVAAAAELDAPRVAQADVVRVLLRRLVDDARFSAQVIDQLRDLKS